MKELLRKKSVKIMLLLIVLLVAMGIVGMNVSSAQRRKEYNSHIEAAEKYLTVLDYEQAIAEYTLALEIEPNSKEILDALEQTYLDYAQSLADAGDYEKAVSILERGYAQISRESFREKIEELKTIQAQKEEEARRLEEKVAKTIEFPFELTDITIMGYDLFTEHYEDVCAAYGCPIDTDPSNDRDYDNSHVENEYGQLSSDVSPIDGGEYKSLAFYQTIGNMDYPAISYSIQKYDDKMITDISVYSSSDWASNLASCGIKLPAPAGSYEDWCRIFQVQEIKEKGEWQETEEGVETWRILTKWGRAYYTENTKDGSNHLEIYLNDWIAGEEHHEGSFSISRYEDFVVADTDMWTYQYKDFY